MQGRCGDGALEGLRAPTPALSSAFSPTGQLFSASRLLHLRHLAELRTSQIRLTGYILPEL